MDVLSSTRLTAGLLAAFLLFFFCDWQWSAFPKWLYLLPAGILYVNLGFCLYRRIAFRGKTVVLRAGLLSFHLGLAVVIFGGLITTLYRFEGGIEAACGQFFTDKAGNFLYKKSGPFWKPDFTGERFFLKKLVKEQDESGNVTRLECLIQTNTDEREPTWISANNPLPLANGNLFLSKSNGRAILFQVQDKAGRTARGTVNFAHNQEKQQFQAPGIPYKLTVRFGYKGREEILITGFPDHILRNKALRPGESVDFGKSKLQYITTTDWAGFLIVRDPGKPFVYGGFLLFCLGLLLYYGVKINQEACSCHITQ